MPQFAPDAFLPQLFWLAVIFATLYFAVVRPTLPKVGRVIEARESQVAADLNAAEAAKGEADGIRTRYDDGMEAARKDAQARVAAARDAAARASDARLNAAGAELDGRIEAALGQIAATRADAAAALAASAAALTAEAVARVAGLEVTAEEAATALAGVERHG